MNKAFSVIAFCCAFSIAACGGGGAPKQTVPHQQGLPLLGTSLEDVQAMFDPSIKQNDPSTGEDFYLPTVNGDKLEVNVEYAGLQNGTRRATIIEFWGHHRSMSMETAQIILKRVAQTDAKSISVDSLSKDAKYVMPAGTMTHDLQYLRSRQLGRSLHAVSYRSVPEVKSAWVRGSCPAAQPGDYEVLTEFADGGVKRIVVASLYLATCEGYPDAD